MKRLVFAAILSTLSVPSLGQPLAYIANQLGNSISVIDTATNTVVDTISTGTASPNGIALSPDGETLYTSASDAGAWELLVIDLETGSIVASPPVGDFAEGLAITPDGSRVYVAEQATDSVSVLDTSTNTIIDSIFTGGSPRAVAAHPDGSRVYAADLIGFVHEIDVASGVVTDSIATPTGPFGIALHPELNRLYVATFDGLTVIDLADNSVLTTVLTGTSPTDVALTCDRAWVTDSVDNQVAVVDLSSHTVLTTIGTNGESWGIDSHPDGSRVYATNLQTVGTVSVIDTAALSVLTSVPVGSFPTGTGEFVAGTKSFCAIFADGFESGDTSAWN